MPIWCDAIGANQARNGGQKKPSTSTLHRVLDGDSLPECMKNGTGTLHASPQPNPCCCPQIASKRSKNIHTRKHGFASNEVDDTHGRRLRTATTSYNSRCTCGGWDAPPTTSAEATTWLARMAAGVSHPHQRLGYKSG